MTIHEMYLNHKPFSSIKAGTKTIEMRMFDEKRQQIKVGDKIEFTNRTTKEKIKVKVLNLHIYKDFKELYSHFNKISLGYDKTENAKPEDMEQYYPIKEITKYGAVGIEIKLL